MSPEVERLMDRVAETPSIFFAPPGARGALGAERVQLEAVVADLFRERGARALEPDEIARFRFDESAKEKRRHAELVLLAAWLFHDRIFAAAPADRMLEVLEKRLAALAAIVMPRAFVEDAERREELVRVCLAGAGIVPAGESAEAAEDRLATLDSVRRKELLASAVAREEARVRRKKELERLRAQEEEEKRKAARTTFED